MRAFFFITILIVAHVATSTETIEKLSEKVHAGLKTLKAKAAHKLHKLTADIDLKKLHNLDVLKLFHHPPKHVHIHEHKKKPLVIDPYQVERLKHYFEPHHKNVAPVHYHHVGHIHH